VTDLLKLFAAGFDTGPMIEGLLIFNIVPTQARVVDSPCQPKDSAGAHEDRDLGQPLFQFRYKAMRPRTSSRSWHEGHLPVQKAVIDKLYDTIKRNSRVLVGAM
jgi:hypothetical protein